MKFYTPNNFKNGRLLFNRFRNIDLTIVCVLGGLSVVSFLGYIQFARKVNLLILLATIIPGAIAFILTIKLTIKHNYMEYLWLKYQYKRSKQHYVWEGVYRFGIDISEERNSTDEKQSD